MEREFHVLDGAYYPRPDKQHMYAMHKLMKKRHKRNLRKLRYRQDTDCAVSVPDANKADEDEADASKRCIVCLQKKATCVALPCGHLNFCVNCSISLVYGPGHISKRVWTKYDKCPKCTQVITEFKYVYCS